MHPVEGDVVLAGAAILRGNPPALTARAAFFLPEIIDKTILMWYDIFKNSTAVRKTDKKESE
jgi:hypothetical protein